MPRCVRVQGAATVRQLMPDAISVFLVAESEAQLVARLVSRKTEPLDKMVTRVKTARWATLSTAAHTALSVAMHCRQWSFKARSKHGFITSAN